MRAAFGAERSARMMEDHTVIMERAAQAQRLREKTPHWKLARTRTQPRGAAITRRGRQRLSELGGHGARGRAWRGPPPPRVAGLAALDDDAFVFDDERVPTSQQQDLLLTTGGEEGSSSSEDGYSSDESAISVLSNGRRVLPPRQRGREGHVLAFVGSDGGSDSDEEGPQRQHQTNASLTPSRDPAVPATPPNVFRLAQDAVEGVVSDIRQWHTLPFESAVEKCEFIATRNDRLPALLMVFTVLLGVIILACIGISCLTAARKRSHSDSIAALGEEERRFPAVRSVAPSTTSSVFRLVPM